MIKMKQTGFTLIEIMIVTVIIGILALIAIPRVGRTKERAIVVSMMAELRNLQLSQEAHYTRDLEFATTLAALTEFEQSADISITFQTNGMVGWTAQTAHVATAIQCAVFVGRLAAVAPLAPATDEAIVKCT
jgi:prepilin-type N-terminal cleavage/methylation domain-containing protein